MTDIDVRRLLMLECVAREGSLRAAGESLGYTTSAVSQQIAKLEREAGVPLLERHPRGVVLTPAGEVLVSHAHRIDELLEAARRDMDDFAGLRRGLLDIGAFPTAGASLLPSVIVEMRRRHPDVELKITSERQAGLLACLRRHSVDVALLWDYSWEPLVEADLVLEHLADDPTVLLLPATHQLSGRAAVDVADLAEEEWIVRAEHPVFAVLRRVCATAGFEPRVVLEANDYQEIQGMVAAGLGIAFAPRLAVPTPRDDVVVVPLEGNPAPRRILMAHLAARRPSAAALAVMEVFRGAAG